MMRFDEYRQLDGTEIALQIGNGNLHKDEVLECAIARAVEVNPKINAIVTPYFDQARSYIQSDLPKGPFMGVPVLLKDLVGELKGFVTGNGTAVCKYDVAKRTSTLYKRYSQMGMVFIGKTNTPEFGLLATTEPTANGPSLNPWNLSKSTGGSSGGSAAAIAAGIVPLASAGDGGGSIRIPASCCGLFGLKPTRGIVPSGPYAELWDGAVSEHVISRTVRDSKAVLAGSIGTDPYSHVPQSVSWDVLAEQVDCGKSKLRIGYTTKSFYGGEVHKDCVDAVEHSVTLLQGLGHEVEKVELEIDPEKLVSCYSDIYTAHVNADVSDLMARYGKKFVKDNVEPLTYFIYAIGKRFNAGAFVLSKRRWSEFSHIMDEWHNSHDLLMSPTLAVPPYNIGEMGGSALEESILKFANLTNLSSVISSRFLYALSKPQLMKVPFTQLANITGQPAMSVPLFWNKAGMPIGTQFVGRRLSDAMLLGLAEELERVEPWFDKVPAM
ncbi:MAG: amidase [Pseudomonadales bacterium]|nr:amidase [Pseudomonadales bacterium]